jgi:hypothetical protein
MRFTALAVCTVGIDEPDWLASSLSVCSENQRLHASLSSGSETMFTLELKFILHSQSGISKIILKEISFEISANIHLKKKRRKRQTDGEKSFLEFFKLILILLLFLIVKKRKKDII